MALVSLVTANVNAATVSFARGTVHSASGGEFIATTSANGTFKTFCIERNEHIGFNTPYNYSISDGAMQGGVSSGNPDPISFGTAYPYSQFRAGSLSGYSSASSTDQTNLQDAFWMLEGALTHKASNVYIAATKAALSKTDAEMIADGGGVYGIKAKNVTTTSGGIAQDQLIWVPSAPDQLTSVPDGGMTLAMLGMACSSRPPHSPTPVRVLTVSGAAGAKANS